MTTSIEITGQTDVAVEEQSLPTAPETVSEQHDELQAEEACETPQDDQEFQDEETMDDDDDDTYDPGENEYL